MFLKSLTLRGFKSFAEKTVLEFEPGITVIVGPNGSGKSNVVDAIAWVLGEQGPKSLRGGKMDDVIFGGAGGRAPLGRAEVRLTIDNTAGVLPIEYSEVTVSRLLYRSGESEYAINATPCRLLDVQELLSDTGVGRELHTIIGQGNLDDVLHGRPDDRRAAIEEAAGISKHRRRKERAVRKLAGVEQQLVRLTDLVGEMRRQLKPLQQQAETARRAAEVQAELREIRLTLRSRELAAAREQARAAAAEQAEVAGRLADLEAAHAQAQAAEAAASRSLAATEPRAARARETVHRLVTVRERLRGTLALAQERARGLAQPLADDREGRSPADMLREAGEVAGELRAVAEELTGLRAAAARAEAARDAARAGLQACDAAAARARREHARQLERTVRLQGEAAALRAALERAHGDRDRLAARAGELDERIGEVRTRLAALQAEAAGLEGREAELTAAAAGAEQARATAAAELDRLVAARRELQARRAGVQARQEASEAVARAAGGDAAAALEAGKEGVIGPVAPALAVEAGYEAAVAAALGQDAAAVLVEDADAAVAAVERLRAAGLGRLTLLLAAQPPVEAAPAPAALAAHVRAPGAARGAVAALLARVLVAEDLASARTLLERHPGHRVVTRAGELVAGGRIEGGAAPESAALAARRAGLEAGAEAQRLDGELGDLASAEEAAAAALAAAEEQVAEATGRLNASDAAISAAADRLARASEEQRLHERELAATATGQGELADTLARDAARLEAVEAQLAGTPGLDQEPVGPPGGQPDAAGERERLAAAAEHAAEEALQARVALSTVSERYRLLAAREAALRQAAQAEREAEARRARERAARLAQARRAGEAATLAGRVLVRLEQSLALATAERDRLLAGVEQARGELAEAGGRRRAAGTGLEELRARSRSADAAEVEARVRDGDLARRLVEEFGVDAEHALQEYAPVAPLDPAGGDGPGGQDGPPDPRTLPDAELRRAAVTLERRLTLLGRVNPLALEDFRALEERHAFLAGQLADLKDSRRDLLKVVRAVDARVQEVFGEAFADVAREFGRTFALLFPGGEGRLVLTDPDDLLTTGVEVEARPPGKRLRRLSLLSGGERSLVALAFCFAIFRARPSPFYVLDEVEAALDDVNLQRFLALLDDVRTQAQLLVVSHQRRTMEAADALYGVSMRAGGISKVVSQRLREPAAAANGQGAAGGRGGGRPALVGDPGPAR
ncbi:MAG TPA: chromosome segregation protein SMC [Actinomycetes bacterium]|nr:chromosome segregation protein SMC [Actinomycetes bacterium]